MIPYNRPKSQLERDFKRFVGGLQFAVIVEASRKRKNAENPKVYGAPEFSEVFATVPQPRKATFTIVHKSTLISTNLICEDW